MSTPTSGAYSKTKVYSLLIFGITAIGFSPILVKFATGESAFMVAAIRTGFAFLLLLPLYLAKRPELDKREVPRKEKIMVAASGILLGVHLICWIASIYYTSVASASVLVTIHPIALIVFERYVYKFRFPITVWVGVITAFAGSVVLGYSDFESDSIHQNPLLGNSLAALAAFIFAGYFLIGNKVRQHRNWLEYVFPVYGWAALTCAVALFIIDGVPTHVSGLVVLLGFALAVGPQIAGHGSLNYAVKYVSPTLIATLILFEPVASSVMAFIFFGEIPLPLSFVGMGIILVGISLTWAKKSDQKE
ncbi:MAG: DMT family transporter [Balneola sp.]|nr:MAG: DMT family transporter [Balneola sp.]